MKYENCFDKNYQIQNKRILSLIAAIENETGKMFHEYDKTFDFIVRDALESLDGNVKLRVIMQLCNRFDRLTMDGV